MRAVKVARDVKALPRHSVIQDKQFESYPGQALHIVVKDQNGGHCWAISPRLFKLKDNGTYGPDAGQTVFAGANGGCTSLGGNLTTVIDVFVNMTL